MSPTQRPHITRCFSGSASWLAKLEISLHQTVLLAQNGMGHMEEQLSAGTRELQRHTLELAAQANPDATPPLSLWPAAHARQRDHARTVTTRFGRV